MASMANVTMLMGRTVGDEFLVNTETVSYQRDSAITALADGGFVVTWSSDVQDDDGRDVYAQRYDADGATVGDEFSVSTYTTDNQYFCAITALADGGFVVMWASEDQDGDGYGIYAQRYGADGASVGAEFQVNTVTAGDQTDPSITALADGGFVVTWTSGDGNDYGISGQRFDADGIAVGDEFQVNTETTNRQWHSSITLLADGGFVVTWDSLEQDGDDYGVFAQQFAAQIFGSADDDEITDELGANWIDGQDGRDVLRGLDGDDTLFGGKEDDILYGGKGNDALNGGEDDDILYGAKGDDVLNGGDGYDELIGGSGSDTLNGGARADTLCGGKGVDTLDGGIGNDVLKGGKGDDFLFGGKGRDILNGGDGTDTADYSEANGKVIVNLTTGTASGDQGKDTVISIENVIGGIGDDTITGSTDNNHLVGRDGKDALKGAKGDDTLDGGEGDDALSGGKGKDTLLGGDDRDILKGGKGSDIIEGGAGNDELYGGKGADVFVFGADDGVDTIFDFKDGKDRLDLSAFDFANKAEAKSHFFEKGSSSDDRVEFDFDGTTIWIDGLDLGDINNADIII